MKMPKSLLLALSLSLFAAPAFAEEGALNISYVKSPFNLQMIVMKEKQLLEKKLEPKGIKVKWHEIDSGAQQATAMASGDLDVGGVLNTTSVQMANAEGNPVIIVAPPDPPTCSLSSVRKTDRKPSPTCAAKPSPDPRVPCSISFSWPASPKKA